jgi:cysteine protease ATG4
MRQRALRYFWDPEPRNEDPSSPICCLGAHYDAAIPPAPPNQQPRSSSPSSDPVSLATVFSANADAASTWPPAFLDDFESRIWMTYRSDFAPIPRSPSAKVALSGPAAALQYAGKLLKGQAGEGFSSDVGWGCMIRSAQSVLANALSTLHLGRGTCKLPFSSFGWFGGG